MLCWFNNAFYKVFLSALFNQIGQIYAFIYQCFSCVSCFIIVLLYWIVKMRILKNYSTYHVKHQTVNRTWKVSGLFNIHIQFPDCWSQSDKWKMGKSLNDTHVFVMFWRSCLDNFTIWFSQILFHTANPFVWSVLDWCKYDNLSFKCGNPWSKHWMAGQNFHIFGSIFV